MKNLKNEKKPTSKKVETLQKNDKLKFTPIKKIVKKEKFDLNQRTKTPDITNNSKKILTYKDIVRNNKKQVVSKLEKNKDNVKPKEPNNNKSFLSKKIIDKNKNEISKNMNKTFYNPIDGKKRLNFNEFKANKDKNKKENEDNKKNNFNKIKPKMPVVNHLSKTPIKEVNKNRILTEFTKPEKENKIKNERESTPNNNKKIIKKIVKKEIKKVNEVKLNKDDKKPVKTEVKEEIKNIKKKENETKEKIDYKKPIEEDEEVKYLINFYKSGTKVNPIKEKIDTKLVTDIYNKIPPKKNLTLQSLIDEIKLQKEKNNLTKENLLYLIYYWIAHNIAYDTKSFFSGKYGDCSPEGVFKNGNSVCSGYAGLLKYINTKFDIETECVSCYSKGYGYKIGEKASTNHEYNVVNLDGKWYPIDPCWSSGNVNGTTFNFDFNDFFFCCPPEYIIIDHYPDDDKWQLIPNKISVLQFQKFPIIKKHFFKHGFRAVEPFINSVEGSGKISIKLYFDKDVENLFILSKLLFNNKEVSDCVKHKKETDYFDIQIKLKYKGNYLLRLFESPVQYGTPYNWIYDLQIVSK